MYWISQEGTYTLGGSHPKIGLDKNEKISECKINSTKVKILHQHNCHYCRVSRVQISGMPMVTKGCIKYIFTIYYLE